MRSESEIGSVPAPWLSVVVIGRNEGERLGRCLDAVRAMRLCEACSRGVRTQGYGGVDEGRCSRAAVSTWDPLASGDAGPNGLNSRSAKAVSGWSGNEGGFKAVAEEAAFAESSEESGCLNVIDRAVKTGRAIQTGVDGKAVHALFTSDAGVAHHTWEADLAREADSAREAAARSGSKAKTLIGGSGVNETAESAGSPTDFERSVELIYVDSGSTDGSMDVATAKGARVLALGPGRPTAARGRNAGWRAARAGMVLFLDGDTVLHPDFVAEAMRAFSAMEAATVWGHRRELFPGKSVYNRVLDLDWVYPAGYTAFCGGDALFRRAALEQVGGFDETLIAGEEPELCRRLLAAGHHILHVDLPMTGHDLAVTRFGQYWRRATRAGHAYAEVAERFRRTNDPFWSGEVDGNRRRALVLVGLLAAGLVLSIGVGGAWPLLILAGLLAALALRTAWKSRWKGAGAGTLLLYGVHSHFQQIPIYVGQLRFWRNQKAGRVGGLVEYK